MGSINSIDTDAALGTILSNFNAEYIKHIVDDSLNMKFRPYLLDPMPNMCDIMERDFQVIKAHSADYIDQVDDARLETYKEIIDIICKYYVIRFTGDYTCMTDNEIYGLARTLYDLFISRFTQYMIGFFIRFIKDNADSIYDYLMNDPDSNKNKDASGYNVKNYIDPRYAIIHSNIDRVIYNMASYDIPFQTILNYITDQNTANILGSLFEPIGDVFKNNYACYILNNQTAVDLLTGIKLQIQATILDFSK